MGESGCGKSTIAAVLTGRAAGYTGSVTIGGRELSTVKESALLQNVTLVSLGSHLFKGTVADNLRMAAPTADDAAQRVAQRMAQGLSRKDAVRQTAVELELPKNVVYSAALSEE